MEQVSVTAAHLERPAAVRDAGIGALAVRASGLSLHFDDRPILREVDLEVPAGAMLSLMGANGAGKSTLLKVLATLVPPSRGELFLFGDSAAVHTSRIRSKIGLISHQPMLYRDLTARENLVFFGKLYDVPKPADRAAELLDVVGLGGRANDLVKTLSRGMTQRVAIARALMHDPEMLLADEPFDGLDAVSAEALERLLARLRAEGRTLIVASHDVRRSLEISERIVVLRFGRLVLDAPVRELSAQSVLKEIAGG